MGPLISAKSRLVKYDSIWPDQIYLYNSYYSDVYGSDRKWVVSWWFMTHLFMGHKQPTNCRGEIIQLVITTDMPV